MVVLLLLWSFSVSLSFEGFLWGFGWTCLFFMVFPKGGVAFALEDVLSQGQTPILGLVRFA